LFDFSLLRTHFCLIIKYSVEFRAALRGNFGDCGPKCESRGLRARYHKTNLIAVVREAAHKDARHAEWLLERQFPHEFAPYDRRPIPVEPEPQERKINVAFVVDTKGKSLEEVCNFPVITEQAKPEPTTSNWKAVALTEPELTEREQWSGDVASHGRVVRYGNSGSLIDLPLDGNGG